MHGTVNAIEFRLACKLAKHLFEELDGDLRLIERQLQRNHDSGTDANACGSPHTNDSVFLKAAEVASRPMKITSTSSGSSAAASWSSLADDRPGCVEIRAPRALFIAFTRS
ncbi:MAG TPA: hypothetical protein VNE63_15395 [Candidatus Acidoferrales bacterium]|nr:hypothetical protein [Candidatus Acidoferrales bacterium]